MFQAIRALAGKSTISKMLQKHFHGQAPHTLVTTGRSFPMASRVDVQMALDDFFSTIRTRGDSGSNRHIRECRRSESHNCYNGLRFRSMSVPCNTTTLMLVRLCRCAASGKPCGSRPPMASRSLYSSGAGCRWECPWGYRSMSPTPGSETGIHFSEQFFDRLEKNISTGRTYRGKVISLETAFDYTGRTGNVKVHRLRSVRREDVILPEKTVALLENNLTGFIGVREQIRQMGLSAKKGLLFYGPPGTGKTHTIHYLASTMPGHSTLLITAEQVVLLEHYFKLARFLQPSIIVVEDVDLIGRERTQMQHPGQEIMLNKLLNEMDGLREDAEVIFILTTNRPDQLEPALASRPGRIDQAIEFPLPDEIGRAKLARLYAHGMQLNETVADAIVSKTKGASAAFIKELMRRSAQFALLGSKDPILTLKSLDAALEEMVFIGGSLNLKILGAAADGLEADRNGGGSFLHGRTR